MKQLKNFVRPSVMHRAAGLRITWGLDSWQKYG